jgi:aspartate racemase
MAVLQKAGVDFICIPCNTVHHYFDEIVKCSQVPVVNLIETVVQEALGIVRLRRIGLLATRGTIVSKIYHRALAIHDIEVVTPEEWELNDLQSLIARLKGSDRSSHAVQKMAESIADKKIQGIILGCTELSLVANGLRLRVPIIDSTEALARRVVRIAIGQESL